MASVSHPDQVNKTTHPFERQAIETLLLRRFFFCPAFEIYGGVKGLYDYGPPGAALQANILDLWRKHFIIEEEMLEVDTTIMTLSDVLKTSGHVDRFTDWMVRDLKTNEVYRADHLVEGVLQARIKADAEARGHALKPVVEDPTQKKKKKIVQAVTQILPDGKAEEYETVLAQIDNFGGKELGELIRKEGIMAPDTGNEVSEPVEFNLMFETQIGPTGQIHGSVVGSYIHPTALDRGELNLSAGSHSYLRPETAQGHFVNFNRLLEFNNGRVPFASAQIGRSFRNEISPKQGLLRVREFTMAEIEHYVDPQDKAHDRFDSVKHVEMQFLPKGVQESGKTDLTTTTIGQAVEDGMVDNMTLGYFIARIYLFLTKIGIDPKRLRFRQHMANEMAHYAADCWDAEILNSYGWIECVGCADRSAYDLTVHANRTQQKMVVRKALDEVHVYDKLVINLEKKSFGPMFKKDAKALEESLLKLTQEQTSEAQKALTEKGEYLFQGPNGQEYKIPSSVMSIKSVTVREQVREFVPNVIEPSFGIGRILYSLLEHSYWARAEDVNRGVLSLPPSVAPVKVLIVPLSNNAELKPLSKQVSNQLRSLGIASRVDDSGASIGKRYARNDELGTPYGVTIDFASVKNGTITLRERDTTFQVIGKVEQVVALLVELCSGRLEWAEAATRLPAYTGEQEL